ncbi:MAG: 3-hydroxybutyrate dehydrogenase [Hyphomonas sp.]|jgi:3-hydroxybutyrate dehydrogenase|uniref:3-hydroxybutyrate dehydrogenase n=1 Tax=Hyphomonas sp. TaxID=87 RepID=UPI001B221D28|nr:3-hydroxybutyrate dehydrogenase [Hyphomonas sp.]MBO6584014.1 3-hydroxybutyrate dehydrogenase [Hyphomonas sp.]
MIKGKTALVTGSTSGIGKAIADRLAQEGCNVVLNGFGDADEIKALQGEMEKEHGVQIGYSGADLTNPDAIEEMMAYVTTDFGGTDILVNNAGTQFVSPLEEFPVAKWDLIMALNLSAAFHTTRMAIGPMKEKGWGRIINTGSAHAKVASPFKSAYVAAKHGLSGLTKVTALEGAEHGVRCNLVCPGYVHTPLVDGQIDDTAKARGMTRDEVVKNVLLAAQPTKEFVTAEQIGGFVAFLCSPDADQINGADLSMDGGWVAQ